MNKRNEYIETWQRENVKRVVIKLNKNNDKDILEYLEDCSNVQGFIKKVLRDYIAQDH